MADKQYGDWGCKCPDFGRKNLAACDGGYPPGADRAAELCYSIDGNTFQSIGTPNEWRFFMGYRYAIFNYVTQSLGDEVTVPSFAIMAP